jgi:hypothetical protein
MATTYESQVSTEAGLFFYQVTIATSFDSQWTSPRVPLKATNWKDAQTEANAATRRLAARLEG